MFKKGREEGREREGGALGGRAEEREGGEGGSEREEREEGDWEEREEEGNCEGERDCVLKFSGREREMVF